MSFMLPIEMAPAKLRPAIERAAAMAFAHLTIQRDCSSRSAEMKVPLELLQQPLLREK